MPILRHEIHQFVDVWNHHKIRRQSDRANAVSGRPWLLYTHPPPEAKQCGFAPNTELLAELQEKMADWGRKYSFLLKKNFC
jgi:hypothetical protein